jgi:hypothetical protein
LANRGKIDILDTILLAEILPKSKKGLGDLLENGVVGENMGIREIISLAIVIK